MFGGKGHSMEVTVDMNVLEHTQALSVSRRPPLFWGADPRTWGGWRLWEPLKVGSGSDNS